MSLRNYHDLFIFPESMENIPEIVEYSKILELKSIAIAGTFENISEFESFKKSVKKLIRNIDDKPDIYFSVLLKEKNPQDMHKKAKIFYRKADLIVAQGGSLSINRFSFESQYIDILIDPHEGRNDSGMDHVMAKLGSQNNTTLALSFKPFIYQYGIPIHKLTQKYQRNMLLAKKYDLNTIIVSNASDKWDLRTGRDLASLSSVLNLSLERSISLTSTNPEKIIKNIKQRNKPGYINENIEVIE